MTNLSEEQTRMVARMLQVLWPENWLETERGILRCLLATKVMFLLAWTALALLFAYLIVQLIVQLA